MNIFTTKKKNMSVYKPNVAATTYSNPLTQYGKSVRSGQGITAAQSAYKSTQPTIQAPKTNVTLQPGQSKMIMGSGMTSQYASNPNNYTAPKAPDLTKKTTDTVTQDPTNVFLQGLEARNQQKTGFINQQKADQDKAIQARYGLLGQQIQGQLPVAQNNFNVFKQNTLAGVDSVRASGERQKANAKDYYGDAQRLAAKTLAETKGRDQRTFSNLNTLDSYGEGSFQQANENSTSEFNRYTQQNLRAQADKLAEIDDTVASAEREANTIISQEEAKLEGLKQQIQFALMNNDQAMAEELRGTAVQSQQLIFDLQDTLDNLKYQADLEKYKLQLEQTDQPSAGFLQTGVPETQADYIYRLNNADNYSKIYPQNTAQNANNGKVAGMIEKLLNSDTKPITGFNRVVVPGTAASTTQASWDGLKALLTLAERGQLKGSGAVSDFETKILEKAAAAGLDPRMDDAAFRQRLQEIYSELTGQQISKPSLDSFIQ